MNKSVYVLLAVACGLALWFAKPTQALSDPLSRFVAWTVTCNSTARSLAPASGFIPRKGFEITNGAAVIYLGGSNVNTTTLGYPIAIDGVKSIDGAPSALYCVSAGSSVLELLGAD